MTTAKKLMLGAAMLVATVGLSTVPAQAARVGVYVGVGGPAYVPPCPGPGYAWVAGNWNGGVWVPGYWNFVRVRVGGPFYRGPVVVDRGSAFYHRDFDRHRDRDDHHFDRDDHFRR